MKTKNIKIVRSNNGPFFYLGNIVIFLLVFSSLYPPVRAFPYINHINSLLLVSWFILAFLDNPRFILNPTTHRFLIYIYILYTVSFPYIMSNGSIGNRFLELSQIPVFYLAYQKNKLDSGENANHLIIFGIIPIILITSFITIKAYFFDPFISRTIKDTAVGFENMGLGIGGYEFIYFLVVCVAILIYMVFDDSLKLSPRYRIIVFFLIIIFSINIQMSNYSTALYLLILSFLIAAFFSSKGTKVSFSFSIIGILVSIIFIQLFFVSFLDLLINFSLGSLNTARFIEIKHYVITNHMGDNMGARVDRWSESLQALKNYPIFGIIQTKLNYFGGYLVGFGQHSQFLDVFALFGFGIGSLQVYIFLQPILKRFKNVDETYSGLSILLLFLIVALFTINNATPSVGFAFFFIFPAVYDWKQKSFVEKSHLTKTK